tara:strand:+ start:761 stop:3412 length:2652 start_codon:yes stop_codon:yes gene_type:complete
MFTSNEIRKTFLDFFKAKGHSVNNSSPLVPINDPSLLFTNAGMVPFKNYFTGIEKSQDKRVVTSQKCVRAGGKHNDLDNVGYTHRHHTFFEMLGNFSFGDYFKEGAIEFAWELITKEFGIPKDKLIVTIFHEDSEAHNLWKKISGLGENRIIKINTNDNFWSMGDTGPCGPCSEIFYDHGDHIAGGPPGSPNEDGDRFVEIWNLVFMQYEQINQTKRVNLPNPSIDTGMGLERMTALMNGTHSNFDIDVFQGVIKKISDVLNKKPSKSNIASYRVIADHLRSTAFLIADGVLPSNEGRGYVLRRICRRATRHADLLGYKEPILDQILEPLIETMGNHYPELINNQSLITETLKFEEIKFRETLSRGLKMLNEELEGHKGKQKFSGETAFKLYDTYGFPLDLTQDLLRSRGIEVNIDTFNNEMKKQKDQTKASWKGSGDGSTIEDSNFNLTDQIPKTNFIGYENLDTLSNVQKIIIDKKEKNEMLPGEEGIILLDKTVFYAESGGQESDSGYMLGNDGAIKFKVNDVQKTASGHYLHIGKLDPKSIKLAIGETLNLNVHLGNRLRTSQNHSATHILHEALRKILGEHITQKGSLVTSSRLRFDFSHRVPITKSQIQEIEFLANEIILQNTKVEIEVMSLDDAMKTGARALFGEKYGNKVRVVKIGNVDGQDFSIELCGGTHAKNTGDIGTIRITSEQGIASGVRRIEAISGKDAVSYMIKQDNILEELKGLLKANQEDLVKKIDQLIKQKRAIEKELDSLLQKDKFENIADEFEELDVQNVRFLFKQIDDVSPKEMRQLLDDRKAKTKSAIIVLIGSQDGKKMIIVGITDDLVKQYSANDIIKVLAQFSDIKGGGRADMAQAGGSYIGESNEIKEKIIEYINTI